ncbi:MAG: RHS repeat-associated core domain-containing protein, partial [Gemmatimonadales bacterium]
RGLYYDPATGRFTQEDPIGLAGGLNLYGFAGGDPVNFSDPFGLCAQGDSVQVAVTVCVNGEERPGVARGVKITDKAQIAAVLDAIGSMSFEGADERGGKAIDALVDAVSNGTLVVHRSTSVGGHDVVTAAGARDLGELGKLLTFRQDVFSLVTGGNMNAMVPVRTGTSPMSVCTATGHEGLHFVGVGHGATMKRLQGGFACR